MGAKVGVHGPQAQIWTQRGTGRPLGTGRPVSQELPDVRCPPVICWFRSVMGVPDVQRLRTSADFGSGAVAVVVRSGPDVLSLALGAGAPVVWSGPDVRSFASGVGAPVVRSGPDVRSLGLG